MTSPSQTVPVGGDTTGETSQADSGVDVGRPQSQLPDDTQNNQLPSPTRDILSKTGDENRGASFIETGIESQNSSQGEMSTVRPSRGDRFLSPHVDGRALSHHSDGTASPHSTLRSPTDFSTSSSLVLSTASRPHTVQHLDHHRLSGDSLPASRVASPVSDIMLGSGKKKAVGSDVRNLIVEKELLESQLRKCHVEVSTLQTENKSLKDKYNRAQARIAQLENQLVETSRKAEEQMNLSLDASSILQRSEYSEEDVEGLEKKIRKLTREVDMLRVENASLEKQIDAAHRSHLTSAGSTLSDRSGFIEGWRLQVNSLRDELSHVKRLLQETEETCQIEAERRKEAASQVIKLTELKALLQQQIEEKGGGTVAEKQVKSLETRLRITEERLHNERADRAGKLSEVENKLLSENARLQASDKELRRQLQRERDRHHNVEQKMRDARSEVDRLRVAMSEQPLCMNYRSPTFKQVITPKKMLKDERTLFEEKTQRYKDSIEDLSHEKDELQRTYQIKIQELVKDKHDVLAQVRGLEDMNAGLMAENDSLKRSLRVSGGMPAVRFAGVNTWEAQNEALKSELRTVSGYLETAQRNVEMFKAEAASLRSQLAGKEQSLTDAADENQRLCQRLSDGDLADRKQQKLDKLTAQITSLEREVERWQSKYNAAVRESNQLEIQVQELRTRAVSIRAHTPLSYESDKLGLEAELREKDQQIYRITIQYNEVENELQRSKQNLFHQQQTAEQYINKLNQLQTQLRQKDRMLDQISDAEKQKNAEISSLKDNLATANDELTQKSVQVKQQEVRLEHNLSQSETFLNRKVSELISSSPKSQLYADAKLATDTLARAESSVRLLQFERETMRQDISRLQAALDGVVHENADLLSKVRHLHQELVNERTLLCHTTADKVDLEHQLHVCIDERESLQKEKTRLETDLARHEETLNNTIHKLELSQTQAASDYETKYHTLSTANKQLAIDLGTSERLLEAREKEIDLLKDTIEHQKMEVEALSRRIELLKEEQSHNKEDVDKFTSDLALKMKEEVVAIESTQQLSTERARLQLEKYQLEQSRSEVERKNLEISELQQKVDKMGEKLRDTEHELHLKDTQVVALESEIKHSSTVGKGQTNHNLERELVEDVAALNRDMLSLCAITGASSLGQRLEITSPRNFPGELTTRGLLKEEMATAARQIEIFKREFEDLASSLQAEKRTVNVLKEQIAAQEDAMYRLESNKKTYELEIDTLRTHLNEHQHAIEQYKKDKQTLYQDVQDLCGTLAEKDEMISRLQSKGNDMVDSVQKEYLNEKNDLIREKQALEEKIARMRDELETLKSQLKQKEGELELKTRSFVDAEQEVKARYEAESNVQKAELSLLDAKRNIVQLQGENTRLQDTQSLLKEDLERAQATIKSLKEQVKNQRDEYSKELHELKYTVSSEKHKHDSERSDLQEQLNKAISNARTTEASLLAVNETKETLFKSSKDFERTIDQLKTQLHDEVTNRKLAEQRIESYKTQLDEIRRNRSGADEQVADLQARIARTETELQLERDKYYKIKRDMTETRTNSTTYEAQAQALQLQVTELQAEVNSLHNQLETQRQNMGGKNKRLALEIKQQIETYENERTKLIQQAQQLSVDLEQARENLALKSRDNLKLQEEVLSLEGKLRETSTSLKKAEDSLFVEKQTKDKFDIRNQELEIEVARLKSKIVDSDDPAHLEVTRKEINKMMAELKRKMQIQFESQSTTDKELRAKELKQLEDYRAKMSRLESALSQEQAMHIVTRTQLTSLEDDNQRLRTQLSNMRKRYTHGAAEERTKSKMEEINEIIARSQTRAQQLLASGAYGEDPLRTLSPSRDYLSLTMPAMPLLNTSHTGIGAGGVTPVGLLSPAGGAGSGGSASASSHDGSDDRSLSPVTKH